MTALPFGLASSPYWAHQLTMPIQECPKEPKNAHLSDTLTKRAQEAEKAATLLLQKQTSLGIHLKPSKCKLTPYQCVQ